MSKHLSDMSDHSLSSSGFKEQRGWDFKDKEALSDVGADEEQEEPLGVAARSLLGLAGFGDVLEENLESEEEEEDTKMSSSKLTSNMEGCLGDEVPLGTAHTINQAVESFCGLPKKDHANLKTADLLKLKKQAEEGLERKFVLMKPVLKTSGEIDVDKLTSIYPVSIRIEEFRESLCRYDMEDVFGLIPEEFDVNSQGDYRPAHGAKLQSVFFYESTYH